MAAFYERLVQEIDRLRDHYAHIEIPGADKPLGEGNEHLVFFIPESSPCLREPGSADGVILDDDYEIDPATQQYRGYLWFREALPSEYLSRLALTNRHFGDDVQFEGLRFSPRTIHRLSQVKRSSKGTIQLWQKCRSS